MLTTEQKATLKTFILAEPDYADFVSGQDWDSIARDMQNPANPAFTVWKTSVTQDEIMQNGFDWTQVDNQTVGKWRIWEALFDNQQTTINPSKANVRAGIDEAWKGTAAMLAVRAAIYVHCKRSANKLEKLFSTGTGTDNSPATLGTGESGFIEGSIHWYEILQAMA